MKIVTTDTRNQNANCGMPSVALFVFDFFMLLLLLITILIQFLVRKEKKPNHSYTKIILFVIILPYNKNYELLQKNILF